MSPRQHLPPQERLSDKDRELAAAMTEHLRQTRANIDQSKEMIELRKWCVVQAIEGYKYEFKHLDSNDAVSIATIAEKILKFVRAPIDEAINKTEQETR